MAKTVYDGSVFINTEKKTQEFYVSPYTAQKDKIIKLDFSQPVYKKFTYSHLTCSYSGTPLLVATDEQEIKFFFMSHNIDRFISRSTNGEAELQVCGRMHSPRRGGYSVTLEIVEDSNVLCV